MQSRLIWLSRNSIEVLQGKPLDSLPGCILEGRRPCAEAVTRGAADIPVISPSLLPPPPAPALSSVVGPEQGYEPARGTCTADKSHTQAHCQCQVSPPPATSHLFKNQIVILINGSLSLVSSGHCPGLGSSHGTQHLVLP